MEVVLFARQILDMQSEIQELREENYRLREYKKMYHELLNESVRHGEVMIDNTLTLLMTPGVTEALRAGAGTHG